jgi:hypothetical protein
VKTAERDSEMGRIVANVYFIKIFNTLIQMFDIISNILFFCKWIIIKMLIARFGNHRLQNILLILLKGIRKWGGVWLLVKTAERDFKMGRFVAVCGCL